MRITRYTWEDAEGVSHQIHQAEGGEQGDPLMPLRFSLAIHDALVAVQAQLREGEVLCAFLNDVHAVTGPNRTRDVYNLLAGTSLAGCWNSVEHREDSVVEQVGHLSSQRGRSGRAGLVGTDEFVSDIGRRAGYGRPSGGCPICRLLGRFSSNVQAHAATTCRERCPRANPGRTQFCTMKG